MVAFSWANPSARDEEWIKLTTNYTVDVSNAIKEVQKIPPYLRPFLVRFNSSIRGAIEYRQRVAKKLKPQLNEMIEARKQIRDEDHDGHFDVTASDQHSLATWSMVCVP